MRKGQATRSEIVRQAAELFNQRGYFGSSIADVMEATGLGKGGIYNHFNSKDELALEAFDYAFARWRQCFEGAVSQQENSLGALKAIALAFRGLALDPPLPGGCPIMNTALESDDTHPALRRRAREAMDQMRGLIRQTVEQGIARGEIRSDADPDETASLMIATLEGGGILSRLYRDPVHLQRTIAHVLGYVELLGAPRR